MTFGHVLACALCYLCKYISKHYVTLLIGHSVPERPRKPFRRGHLGGKLSRFWCAHLKGSMAGALGAMAGALGQQQQWVDLILPQQQLEYFVQEQTSSPDSDWTHLKVAL